MIHRHFVGAGCRLIIPLMLAACAAAAGIRHKATPEPTVNHRTSGGPAMAMGADNSRFFRIAADRQGQRGPTAGGLDLSLRRYRQRPDRSARHGVRPRPQRFAGGRGRRQRQGAVGPRKHEWHDQPRLQLLGERGRQRPASDLRDGRPAAGDRRAHRQVHHRPSATAAWWTCAWASTAATRPASASSSRTRRARCSRTCSSRGSAPGEGYMAPPGDIRAYDVLSGKLVWTFHTVPRPGEFGYDTWPKDAWRYIGGVNNWGELTIDAARGIAYIPLGSPNYDFFGADRHRRQPVRHFDRRAGRAHRQAPAGISSWCTTTCGTWTRARHHSSPPSAMRASAATWSRWPARPAGCMCSIATRVNPSGQSRNARYRRSTHAGRAEPGRRSRCRPSRSRSRGTASRSADISPYLSEQEVRDIPQAPRGGHQPGRVHADQPARTPCISPPTRAAPCSAARPGSRTAAPSMSSRMTIPASCTWWIRMPRRRRRGGGGPPARAARPGDLPGAVPGLPWRPPPGHRQRRAAGVCRSRSCQWCRGAAHRASTPRASAPCSRPARDACRRLHICPRTTWKNLVRYLTAAPGGARGQGAGPGGFGARGRAAGPGAPPS